MKSSSIAAIACVLLVTAGCLNSPGAPPQEPTPTNNNIVQVSQLVSADEGGEVEVGESAVLTIAPGALAQDTVITVTVSDPSDTPADSVVKGKIYDFGPDGLQFSEPAILELETEPNAFGGPGSISKFAPNLGLWDEGGPTGSAFAPNLGLWDQVGDSGSDDFAPNLGLWDGDPEKMATAVMGFSRFATTLPGHGVYSCGIDDAGGACCWGQRVTGCTDCLPAGDPLPTSDDFTEIAPGAWSDCGLRENGTVACWGSNPPVPPTEGGFVQVATGRGHACALKDDGTARCFMAEDQSYDVPSPSESNLVAITAGDFHACALEDDGSVFCWGPGRDGETDAPSGTGFVQIDAGARHTCAVTGSGAIDCWGSEISGLRRVPSDDRFVQVSVGVFAACALTEFGEVVCWGADFDVVAGTPTGSNFTRVTARHRHACAGQEDGGVVCWGEEIEDVLSPPADCRLPVQAAVECEAGFRPTMAGCVDIDECEDMTASCDANAVCMNLAGSFECECSPGFEGDGFACTDVDECSDGTDNCGMNATCTNNAGSFDCACDAGYAGDGVTCTDVDECADGTDNCDANATCTNSTGGFGCACDAGFTGDGLTCADVDECTAGTDNCDTNATCTNVPGTFDCMCDTGYTGDGITCADVDECADGTDNCDSNAMCTNTTGSFDCMCVTGFTGNGVMCADVDECAMGSDNCDGNAMCSNVPGTFDCMCNAGYMGDGVTCADVDECATGADNCDLNATCTNTTGSFDCMCNSGFSGDGVTCVPISNASNIAAGAAHTCTIRSGEIFCWGDNMLGQLGDGTNDSRPMPVQVGVASDWSEIAAGADHTCAINSGGELWCWGANFAGQLGDGTTIDSPAPVRESTNATNWSTVTAGVTHTCAMTNTGSVFCWGENLSGQLGDGTTNPRVNPTQESTGVSWSVVKAGGDHTCAIDGLGNLSCWGANFAGQLGNGMMGVDSLSPFQIGGPWDDLALGGAHTCATTGGQLHCWGANLSGQLGVGGTMDRDVPTRVGADIDWAVPVAGGDHSCALKDSGELWCWGYNIEGQLGIGDTTDRDAPVQVGVDLDWTDAEIPVIGAQTCALKGGGIECWGANFAGQLGVPSSRNAPAGEIDPGSTWTSVSAIGGEDVPFMLGLSTYGCGIKDGAPWCWGSPAYHLSGSDHTREVPGTIGNTNWTQVSSGTTHACGLQDGAPRCWGDNADGGLGDGSNTPSDVPVVVQGTGADTDWTMVSAGSGFSCGIQSGALLCWGRGVDGQLGDNQSMSSNTPVDSGIATGSMWSSVSAGHIHACGIHAGDLYCWGDNPLGQLGNGTVNPAPQIPTQPTNMGTSFTVVAAGIEHTCAIDTSGTLLCAGDNTFGELGNGSTTPSLSFVPIGTAQAPWSDVALGRDHTCGIAGGDVYCWGANQFGQLGDATFNDATTPVAVATTINDWVEVSVGDVFSCARRSGGQVHCWGDNNAGQMGDDSLRFLTPRPVALP